MFATKFFVCVGLLVAVNARSIILYEENQPYGYVLSDTDFEELSPVLIDEEQTNSIPIRAARERRQAGGCKSGTDPVTGAVTQCQYENNGNQFSLTQAFAPRGQSETLSAAGTLNLHHSDNHKVDANAFASHTSFSNTARPDINTYGGGIDYMYKEKVGAGINVAHTPLFDKTDYSAVGKVNLFKNPTTSLDWQAGASRSFSPYIRQSSWEPFTGLSFSKSW